MYFCIVTSAIEIPAYRYRMILEPLMTVTAVAGFGPWFDRTGMQRIFGWVPFASPSPALNREAQAKANRP
jgi:hypothetical protein